MQNKAYGNVFKNRSKQKDSHPDYRGDVKLSSVFIEEIKNLPMNAEGYVVLEFSGWIKQGPKAGSYISCNLQAPRAQAEPRQGNAQRPASQPAYDLEDDVPF